MHSAITFELPEEAYENAVALAAPKIVSAIFDLDKEISELLEDNEFKTPEEVLKFCSNALTGIIIDIPNL